MEKIVDFSKLSIKKIRELIVFTALIVVALWKFDVVLGVIKAVCCWRGSPVRFSPLQMMICVR